MSNHRDRTVGDQAAEFFAVALALVVIGIVVATIVVPNLPKDEPDKPVMERRGLHTFPDGYKGDANACFDKGEGYILVRIEMNNNNVSCELSGTTFFTGNPDDRLMECHLRNTPDWEMLNCGGSHAASLLRVMDWCTRNHIVNMVDMKMARCINDYSEPSSIVPKGAIECYDNTQKPPVPEACPQEILKSGYTPETYTSLPVAPTSPPAGLSCTDGVIIVYWMVEYSQCWTETVMSPAFSWEQDYMVCFDGNSREAMACPEKMFEFPTPTQAP